MSEVTLQKYCQEIEDLIDQGALDAAVNHCQHVLKIHPKHLPTYRLLGKTALEKNDLRAAADLFSRVLSMDPEDFVARVGMSIASDQDGTLEQAVWHMERAYELAPDNQAIVGELRRLYGRRDGVEPEKVSLTQGALARLHARGSLYAQAINEFRSLLKNEPDRVDLRVALAETLWRADKRIEAAETSLAILEKLPYCLKANLILGEIWSSSGREEEGVVHLERAQKVDPENEIAQSLFGERSPLPPAEVRIGRIEYVAPPAPAEQEPDWLEAIIQEGASPAPSDKAVPDWLQAVAASADVEAAPQQDVTAPEPSDVPSWLQDAAATAEMETAGIAVEPEATTPAFAEDEMPDWLAELTSEPSDAVAEPLAAEEIPGWLEQTVPSDAAEVEMAPGDADSLVEEEIEAAPGDMPDWLAELAPDEIDSPVGEEVEVAPGEMPDWLAELAPGEAAPAVGAEESPDWLADLAPSGGAPPDGEETDLTPADIPDWLTEMAPTQAVSQVVPELDLPPADVPEWMIEDTASQEEPVEDELEAATPPLVAAETPDWLAELVEKAESSFEEPAASPPGEEETVPDWLAGFQEEEAPEIPAAEEPEAEAEAELMARLEEMSPEEAFAAWEGMLATGEAEEATPSELPEPEAAQPEEAGAAGPIVIEEPDKEKLVYPEGARREVTESEAELMARLEEMSPEEAFAAWEEMLATGEAEEAAPSELPEPEAAQPEEAAVAEQAPAESEAELMARLEEMSPEDAFAAWEEMLATGEAEEAAPSELPEPEAAQPQEAEATEPIVIEEPDKEKLVYPEGAGREVTESEAELMARLEEMSPEEAFAAWEEMLATGEAEEVTPSELSEPEAAQPEEAAVAEQAPAESEADLMARLEEMSPEEAFAAWEEMLAAGEAEEAAPSETQEPEAAQPEEAGAAGPIVIEEPDKEKLVYPEGARREVTESEAELMARLEEMSPEDAFAAWEEMLAEGQAEADQIPVEEIPEAVWADVEPEKAVPEAVAQLDDAWMALVEDEGLEEGVEEGLEEVVAEEWPSLEPATEFEDQTWMALTGDEEPEQAAVPGLVEAAPTLETEPVAGLDESWMALAEDEEPVEATVSVVAEEAPAFEPPVEDEALELPDWVLAEAAETVWEPAPGMQDETHMGPDWVWLAEDEEAEIKTLEPEAVVPAEPEPPARPTWVALEDQPAVEAPVAELATGDEKVAKARKRVAADRDDDSARLALARSLWSAGQREQAHAEYERLVKSPLRDDVIADLEQITTDEPSEASLLRLLGDAYMKDNRLQEALGIYRRALSSL
jgi:predicted Zn-dependent protease